jgi:hypothetical protein
LFYIRFKVLPGFAVNFSTALSNIQLTLNEGNPNFLLVNGQIRSLPCTPVANVNPSGNVTFCANQPVQLSGSSGTAYQYQWSRNGVPVPGATNRLFTPLQSGNYTLRVSLNSSCSVVSDTVRVTINPSPIAQITPYADTLFACSGDSVTLRAYREAGYTLQWFRNGSTISGATDTVFKAATSGFYTVRSTLNGCQTLSAAQMVTIRPLPAKPVILVSGSPTCAGDSATLRIPQSVHLRQWFSATGPIAGANDTVLRVPPGRYTVRLTDAFGCFVLADSVSVVAASASAQIDPSGPTTFCQGRSVNLDLTQPTTYVRWFRNGVQLADTIRPINVTQSGSYTAAYRLSGNQCIFTTPAVQITVVPLPVVTLDSLLPVCVNLPAFQLTGGLPVGGTYLGPGVVNNQFNPSTLSPGSYTIKYGFTQNGCSDTVSRVIQVLALPGTTFPAPAPVCVNSPNITLTGGLPTGGAYFGVAVTAGSFNPALVGVGVHTVGYTTQNANGCRDTVLRTITVHSLVAATISQGATAAYCAGSSTLLNANTGTGLSYQWLKDGLVLSAQTSASLVVSQPGSYRVVVTNASGCSDSSVATLVTVNPLPQSVITPAGSTTLCQGSSVLLQGSAAADRSYRWLLNGLPISGNLTANLTASTAGTYRLIVTNTLTGCFDTSAGVSVTVNPLPSTQITTGGSTTLCSGDSVTLSVPVAASLSYQWLLNGSPVSGATQASLQVGLPGIYRVLVSNSSTSCFDTSAAVNVVVNPRPVANITPAGPTTICEGASVTLNATAGTGLSYEWLRNGIVLAGQTTSSLSVTLSGNYRVIVRSSAGCSDSSAVTVVTVNPKPDAPILTLNVDTIFASPGSDLVWFRNGVVLAGITDSVLIVTQDGNYNAIRLSTLGCASDSSNTLVLTNVSVAEKQLLAVRIYPNPSRGLLKLELGEQGDAELDLEIRNLTGQLVHQQTWPQGSYANRLELDLSALPQAVYLVKVQQGIRYRYERIIIQY